VIVHYGRSEAKADAVVTEIRAAGGRAESLWLQIARVGSPAQSSPSMADRSFEYIRNLLVSEAAVVISLHSRLRRIPLCRRHSVGRLDLARTTTRTLVRWPTPR